MTPGVKAGKVEVGKPLACFSRSLRSSPSSPHLQSDADFCFTLLRRGSWIGHPTHWHAGPQKHATLPGVEGTKSADLGIKLSTGETAVEEEAL